MTATDSVVPTVLIAEDEPMLLQALAEMVGGERRFQLIAVTADGAQAIAMARQFKPDLALLDYRLPGADGLAITDSIKEHSPNTQVVMFTAYNESSLSLEAAQAGVFAFLVKGCEPSLIVRALDSAWENKKKVDAGSSTPIGSQQTSR